MKQLNAAYSKGDGEAIGNLVRQWETSPYAVAGRPLPVPRPRSSPRSSRPSSGSRRRARPISHG